VSAHHTPSPPAPPQTTPFRAEIDQIPDALLRLAVFYEAEGRELLREAGRRLREAADVTWSGMGTSCFAPEAAFPRLERSGVSCRSMDAGEWLHFGQGTRPGRLAVLTSQSGESVEVRRLVEEGRVGAGFIAITNNLESFVARHAGLALPLLAGEEASISTRTYANTLAVSYLLASAVEGEESISRRTRELRAAAEALRGAELDAIARAAERVAPAPGTAFVGRGPGYVAARQCALTFMEGTRRLAAGFAGGAFNHGPAELLSNGFSLVVLQGSGGCRALDRSLASRAAALGADVIILGAQPAERVDGALTVEIPGIRAAPGIPAAAEADQEELFPLLACRVQNILLYDVAALRGHKAGVFRNGAKVTTRE
jgi:glucosamine--fructose-6-phosphate aminotransferase (isomerizing)